ncbi:putative ubiquitin-specific protease [Martiniozyma asiatica (nom. inval.)]|nr:putative ubiquitin-specific protease [Martiniozyma asiatica]
MVSVFASLSRDISILWNQNFNSEVPKQVTLPPSLTDIIYRHLRHTFKNPRIIVALITFLASLYIVYPSLTFEREDKKMTSKRPDKYTTGFINPSIDCFANSTVQSLSNLAVLNNYFNSIKSLPLPPAYQLPQMPLHDALMKMVGRLQQPIYKQLSISVWDLLHVLEKIHQKKIARNQHDAQELMQLIIETLENEYDAILKLQKSLKEKDEYLLVPPFPFKSILESKLRCMRCQHTSKPTQVPMNILSLNVPQENTTLENMLRDNQSEVIEGYSCLVCTLRYIYQTFGRSDFQDCKLKINDEEQQFLKNVAFPALTNVEDLLQINDEIGDNPFYISLKNSNLSLNQIGKSTVHREILWIEAPEILTVHLSRSIYTDQAWRNSSSVEFPEQLTLSGTDNSIKYKLKSVIRHQGSHNAGHYECYKQKPMFYKRINNDEYYHILPTINNENENIFEFENENEVPVLNKDNLFTMKTTPIPSDFLQNDTPFIITSADELLTTDDTDFDVDSDSSKLNPLVHNSETLLDKSKMKEAEEFPKPIIQEVDTYMNSDSIPHLEIAGYSTSDAQTSSSLSIAKATTGGKLKNTVSGVDSISSQFLASTQLTTDVNIERKRSLSNKFGLSGFRRRMSSIVSGSNISLGRQSISSVASSPISSSPKPEFTIEKITKGKDKKLASVIKKPYWRISDGKITEVKTSDVLGDGKAVYMLIYERM